MLGEITKARAHQLMAKNVLLYNEKRMPDYRGCSQQDKFFFRDRYLSNGRKMVPITGNSIDMAVQVTDRNEHFDNEDPVTEVANGLQIIGDELEATYSDKMSDSRRGNSKLVLLLIIAATVGILSANVVRPKPSSC